MSIFRVQLIDVPTEAFSDQMRFRKLRFLEELTQTPALLMCGPVHYDRLNLTHDGERLICELEAIGPSTIIL